jgi:RNA polymerase-binding protein DksA
VIETETVFTSEVFLFSNKFPLSGKDYHKANGGLIIMATAKRTKKDVSMAHDFIEKMEKSLLELKAGIVENLIAGSEDFKEIVEGMDPKDLADVASDDIDRKMIEAIGSQELKRLKLIDSALTRIKQGKYGLCVKCGKRIPSDRLEAIPYALMCIECKSEEERRNR